MVAVTTTIPSTSRNPVSETKINAISPNGMPAYEATMSRLAMEASTCLRSIMACEVADNEPIIVAMTTASRGLTTNVIRGTARREKPKPERV